MTKDRMSLYRLGAAALLLLVYLSVAGIMLYNLYHPPLSNDAPKPEWDHILVVFNAIGAIATTAAGVVLGAEVQQGNVQAARDESLRLSARVAQHDAAMREALEALEPGATLESTSAPVSLQARRVLLRAIGQPLP